MTKNKKIAVIVCAIIVIAAAIIVPVTVHNIKKGEVEPSTSGVVENTSEDSEVVSLTRRETTTAEPETTETPTTTEAPATTAPEATTRKQNQQSVTTTKSSTTKTYTTQPAPTQPPTTAQNTYGLPAAIANSNTAFDNQAKKEYFDEDAKIAAGQLDFGVCEHCGKKNGHGTHGTCLQPRSDFNCPLCGKYVKAYTCHSCVY